MYSVIQLFFAVAEGASAALSEKLSVTLISGVKRQAATGAEGSVRGTPGGNDWAALNVDTNIAAIAATTHAIAPGTGRRLVTISPTRSSFFGVESRHFASAPKQWLKNRFINELAVAVAISVRTLRDGTRLIE